MLTMMLRRIDHTPRQVLALISAACVALLACGLYLQHVVGLVPCPMCIVQRYALIGVALFSALASLPRARLWRLALTALAFVTSGFGAAVAARQSWLQWYPPNIVSCGRDFYGMIEHFPLSRAVPMILRGSGDCTAVDWTMPVLGGSIANWSCIGFVVIGLLLLTLLLRGLRAS